LEITWRTPLAIRMSDVRSWALLRKTLFPEWEIVMFSPWLVRSLVPLVRPVEKMIELDMRW